MLYTKVKYIEKLMDALDVVLPMCLNVPATENEAKRRTK